MTESEIHIHAVERMRRIFGTYRADRIVQAVLADLQLASLATANDLLEFGAQLERRGGLEAAVGAMMRVQARLFGCR